MKRLSPYLAALMAVLVLAGAVRPAAAVTDDEVVAAIEKGKEYLINSQGADGSYPGGNGGGAGDVSCLVYMTLAFMGMHPNREVMSKGLDYMLTLSAENGLTKPGYSLPMQTMALAYLHNKLLGEKRGLVRQKMYENVLRFQIGQTGPGGWRYQLQANQNWDFSVTQWPILGLYEANQVGIEIPLDPLRKALALYYQRQKDDGGWNYGAQGEAQASYGSMTAASLASVILIDDILNGGAGCPCAGGRSTRPDNEAEQRIEKGLEWLAKNYTPTTNPGKGGHHLYWLYCAERVGLGSGRKRWGEHDWYAEGADFLVKKQAGNGAWGSMVDTCFALLFLYKGRAPILYNKLRFEGQWNNHRRDAANLIHYIARTKEQPFQWQIVSLDKPEDLHDAPILYITAETPPPFTPEDKAELRKFTDTGGTILFEASCGNPAVRAWFKDFAKEVWPEWPLAPLGPDHGVFTDPYHLDKRPELLAIHDGMRTILFFAMDDVSCAWHTKALASRQYLFNWGINMVAYATDHSPLRAKLAVHRTEPDRYTAPVSGGGRAVHVVRVRHAGDWATNQNYKPFESLAAAVEKRAGVRVTADDTGVAPEQLAGTDVAYLTGAKSIALTEAQQQALKQFVAGGGFLWFEAAGGSLGFDEALQKLMKQMGWRLELMPRTSGVVSGRMDGATGYNLSSGVKFRQALRVARLGRYYAEVFGVYDGDKLVGIYSPFDVVYSTTHCEAYKCRGYQQEDAEAVATNLVLFFSTR